MRRLGTPVLLALLGSGALAAVLVTLPGQRIRATAAYVIALGALGLVVALADLGRARRDRASAFEAALRPRRTTPERVRPLDQIEHDVAQGLRNPVDLHRRLRPILREVAARRLAAGYGVALDGTTGRARTLLGEETWQLLLPDRTEEDEAALDEAGLDRVLGVLERL